MKKAVVILDNKFGNTRKIAKALKSSIEEEWFEVQFPSPV
jgi:flavodoxin